MELKRRHLGTYAARFSTNRKPTNLLGERRRNFQDTRVIAHVQEHQTAVQFRAARY
jgi:hypothetical protein